MDRLQDAHTPRRNFKQSFNNMFLELDQKINI